MKFLLLGYIILLSIQLKCQYFRFKPTEFSLSKFKTESPGNSGFQKKSMTSPVVTNYMIINIPEFKHSAFFCRMEERVYKKSGRNIKFNLGLNSYVNYLEGKAKYY
jgi:hypothetical protein